MNDKGCPCKAPHEHTLRPHFAKRSARTSTASHSCAAPLHAARWHLQRGNTHASGPRSTGQYPQSPLSCAANDLCLPGQVHNGNTRDMPAVQQRCIASRGCGPPRATWPPHPVPIHTGASSHSKPRDSHSLPSYQVRLSPTRSRSLRLAWAAINRSTNPRPSAARRATPPPPPRSCSRRRRAHRVWNLSACARAARTYQAP